MCYLLYNNNMNYRDYDDKINISYKNIGENDFCSIINPLLSCTKIYKRSVGFFNSSALKFIDDGIMDLARNGGQIQLATSPKLSDDDIIAINSGYQAREILEKRLFDEINEAVENIDSECAQKLFQLIKEGIMDIKIVIKNGGMYHDKLAVLTDYAGNTIAFVGSNNESSSGYNFNYEKVRVYRSWKEEDRVYDETEEFESIWNNSNEYLDVYNFSDAYKNKVIECVENRINNKSSKKKDSFELRPYQEQAINAWKENGYKGFFEMATGTGKTYTSLYSIIDLIRNEKVFTIILAPYKHLVNQWYETIEKTFKDVYVIKAFSEMKLPEQLIYAEYIQSKKEYKPIIVVSTILSFSLERYQELYKKIEYKKLLIVDEAHNFVNKLSDDLSNQFEYKLGLSATPVFGKDVEKTTRLLEWFGGKVMTFPIEDAIGKYLVNYEYIPIFVDASEDDEDKFRKATQQMLSCIDPVSGKIIDEEKFNIAYRARLRSISMADEKINQIQRIFDTIDGTDHTIIYCSDGKLFREGLNKNEAADIKHLDFILKLINRSLLYKDTSLKASRFTSYESAQTRMELIDLFNSGKLNYLVAIKCLDEGIDIPSIKNALILSSNDNYREFVQRRGRILRKYEGKELSKIYDVIVLPSLENKSFAEIELRRYYEYARLAINKESLLAKLRELLSSYGLTESDIQFKNEYVYGGDLDE